MGLVGKYVNTETKQILEITEANNHIGHFKGSLTVTVRSSQKTLGVTGHYHFLHNTQPQTLIVLQSIQDDGDPGIYEAWAGVANGPDYPFLQLRGGRGLVYDNGTAEIEGLSGNFVKA